MFRCLRVSEIGMCTAGVLIESDNEKKRRSKLVKLSQEHTHNEAIRFTALQPRLWNRGMLI
jgi:hypothetical protein